LPKRAQPYGVPKPKQRQKHKGKKRQKGKAKAMQQPFACKARRPCRVMISIKICMQQPFVCKASLPLKVVAHPSKSRK
jgi:hypothetical protein